MDGLAVAETRNVIETIFPGVVRQMKADTPVESENEELEVIPQSNACAYSHLAEELAHLEELGIGLVCIIICQIIKIDVPNIAGIEENSALEIPEKAGAVFQVGLQLDVTVLKEIGKRRIVKRDEIARTYASGGESADAVCSSHVESFAERRHLAITVDNLTLTRQYSRTTILQDFHFNKQ